MFHLDLKALRSFAAVARDSSVTRAAERLNLSQPTVSGQIKELEQGLGYPLFYRTSRRVTLSEYGERLLPMVQALLSDAETLRHEAESIQHALKTHFRLGAALYVMDFADRVELLETADTSLPSLEYTIDSRLQSDQIPDLLNGRLDAALLLGRALPSSSFTQNSRSAGPGMIVNELLYPNDLSRVVLRRREIGLLVPEGCELAAMNRIPGRALAGQQIAMLSTEHGERLVNPISSFLLSHGAILIGLPEGNALAAERYAQRHGVCAVGVGWFPLMPGMQWRPIECFDFYLDFALVLGNNANHAARRFFDFTRRWQAVRDSLEAVDLSGADGFQRSPAGETAAIALQ